MANNTGIEWTDATWSPLRVRVRADARAIAAAKGYTSLLPILDRIPAGKVGPHCEHVSAGCEHCYAETNNHRCLPANGTGLPFDRRSRDLVETFVDEKMLTWPLRWRGPALYDAQGVRVGHKAGGMIFVENQSDLFGEWVPDAMIDRVFAVMALAPQHTFQVLTKRPERMREYFRGVGQVNRANFVWSAMARQLNVSRLKFPEWPLPNVWLGVSVEDQPTADARIPLLLGTPAAARFVSYEPALGPVDFARIDYAWQIRQMMQKVKAREGMEYAAADYPDGKAFLNVVAGEWFDGWDSGSDGTKLDWIICGGESGPGARPMHPDWARGVRDQCVAAGVPFFFTQWGAWDGPAAPGAAVMCGSWGHVLTFPFNGAQLRPGEDYVRMARFGKKAAGRLLDGREWSEFPAARS